MPHAVNLRGAVADCPTRGFEILWSRVFPDMPFFSSGLLLYRKVDSPAVILVLDVFPSSGQSRGVEVCVTADLESHSGSLAP